MEARHTLRPQYRLRSLLFLMTILAVVLGLGMRAREYLRRADAHQLEVYRIRRPTAVVSVQLLPGQERAYSAAMERTAILADRHAERAAAYRSAIWRPWMIVNSDDLAIPKPTVQ